MVVIAWLGGLTLVIIVAAAFASFLAGAYRDANGHRSGIIESMWQSLLRVLDSGTFAGDNGTIARIIALTVTLSGIFIAGSLIGLIASAVDQKIADLRKGRSTVLEHGHTLVLGFSPRLAVIVSELVEANSNQKHAAVVVLAKLDKTEMEDALDAAVPDRRTTRLVFRSGDPASPADLEMVNIAGARSVIVLGDTDGDAGVVKAILAVKSLDPEFERAHIVAEFADPDNADTLRAVTDGRVLTVNSDAIIAELTARACHQAGLSTVYRELLDFDGDEIYFTEVPELVGHTYAEAVMAFPESSVMGRYTADGDVHLNPEPGSQFEAGDQVIAVSADDDTVVCDGIRALPTVAPRTAAPSVAPSQRILIVGWSALGPMVIRELGDFLPSGSAIHVVVDTGLATAPDTASLSTDTSDLIVHEVHGPQALFDLVRLAPFDQAIVLGYRGALTAAEADSRTLLTLLTLRKMFGGNESPMRIVAEVLDRANVAIAVSAGVDDFIVSDELSSLMIAQLSERADLLTVFDELFDSAGCDIVLRPADHYVDNELVSVAQLRAAGLERHETVLGYRIAATSEIVVNPARAHEVQLGPDDEVLVLTRAIVRASRQPSAPTTESRTTAKVA
jgi:TrkA-N domain.